MSSSCIVERRACPCHHRSSPSRRVGPYRALRRHGRCSCSGLQAWLEEAAARSGGAGGAPAPSPAAPAPVADAANDAGDAGDVLVVHVSLAAATASGAALHSGAEPAPPGASACGSQLRGMDAADGIRGRLELAGGAGAGGGQLWQEEGCPPDAAPLEWLDAVVRDVGALPGARQARARRPHQALLNAAPLLRAQGIGVGASSLSAPSAPKPANAHRPPCLS